METWAVANREQACYWNGDEAAHWLVHEERYERMLAPFTGHLLTAAAIGRADRVVDIGCGTGSTTRAAGRAAIEGEALGVDLSVAMLRQAARRAQEEGLTNVRFEHGDAQVHRFTPGVGDVALSRFGVMFFADPAAAFANIARGLRPGGRLVFVCWQNLADNEWIVVPGAAAQHVALPPPGDPTAPGPFSLGERDRLATVLRAAALSDVAIEPIAELSRRVGDSGHVYGIDHSDVMLQQATRRNASAIAAGRVSLSRASVDQLPPALGGPFDAILTVNSLGFWPAPTERLDELRRRLRPGGRIAIASQPRCPGATESTSRNAAREIETLLQDAGYTKTRTETLDLDPPVVCILAVNPDPDRDRSSPASDPTS